MPALISSIIPYFVLLSHLALVFLIAAFVFRNSWGGKFVSLIGSHALGLSFLAALAAMLGSLFYSEVIGFEPCVLCWWQRVFLFPLVVIFGMALWKKTSSASSYAMPLILLAAIVSLYQSYANLGGASLLPCTASGGACSRVYVLAFGYITIPLMSLTVALFLLFFALARKFYLKNENRNS